MANEGQQQINVTRGAAVVEREKEHGVRNAAHKKRAERKTKHNELTAGKKTVSFAPWLCTWNVHSLDRRVATLVHILPQADIFAIQEVWKPSAETFEQLLKEGFASITQTRVNRSGGGVGFLYRRAAYRAAEIPVTPANSDIEVCMVRFAPVFSDEAYTIASVYVSPTGSADVDGGLCQTLKLLANQTDIIVGDFNAHSPVWDPLGRQNALGSQIKDFLRETSPFTLVTNEPVVTHVGGGGLDLVFARTGLSSARLGSLSFRVNSESAMGSDHYPVWLGVHAIPRHYRTTLARVAWKRVTPQHWEAFHKNLAEVHLPDRGSSNVRFAALRACIVVALTAFPKCGGRRSHPRSSALLACIEVASLARQAALVSGDWKIVQEKEAELATLACAEFEKEIFAEATAAGKSGALWRLWERDKPRRGPSLMKEGKFLNDRQQARMFASFFAHKHRQREHELCEPWLFHASQVAPEPFSMAELEEAIGRQKKHGAAGPDKIPPQILDHLPPSFLSGLLNVANRCLLLGDAPESWIFEDVVPTPKAEKDLCDLPGYRPVALTSVLCRIVERMFDSRMQLYVKPHPLQFGFVSGRNVEMPLAHLFHVATECLRSQARGGVANSRTDSRPWHQGQTLLLCIDFTDAYCSIGSDLIAASLRKHGVPDEFIRFVVFLCRGRSMRVRVGDDNSAWIVLECGTAQGGILSALCWRVVLDPMLDEMDSKLTKAMSGREVTGGSAAFADDCLAFVGGNDIQSARNVLAVLLKKVVIPWSRRVGIELSPKTKVVVIGGSTDTDVLDPIKCDGGLEAKIVKDPSRVLGLIVERDVSFNHHVTQLRDSVLPLLEKLKRWSRLLSNEQLRVLYIGAVRSKLLYAAPIWFPYLSHLALEKLEVINRLGARIVSGALGTANNADCLAEARLYPLAVLVEGMAATLGARILRMRGTPLYNALIQIATPSSNVVANRKTMAFRPCFSTGYLKKMRDIQMPRCAISRPDATSFTTKRPSFCLDLVPRDASAPMKRLHCERLWEKYRADIVIVSDGSVQETKSAGAFSIRFGESVTFESASAGSWASSFTAEHVGMSAALSRAFGIVLSSEGKVRSVTLFADALSVLKTLQKGPPSDPLWGIIGPLLERLGSLWFVYLPAHCGFPPHDAVDEKAKNDANEGRSVNVTARDEARYHKNMAIAAYEVEARSSESLRTRITQGCTWHLEPIKGLSRQDQRLLAQMRTGAVGNLGGWRHEQPEDCPRCGGKDVLSRNGGAIRHLFECPVAPWPDRRRALEINGLDVLVKKPATAVLYAKEFLDE